MSDTEFPLVISMTGFQNFRRCRKLFQLSQLFEYKPKEKEGTAAASGRAFHELMHYAARTGGSLPSEYPPDPDMLPVARAYLNYKPLPSGIIAAERGYFAEIAPAVYIRASFDLVYQEDNRRVIRDYKTFRMAPTLDPDLDFQANDYLVVGEIALGWPDAEFEWEYVRQELGRLLSGGKGKDAVWTDWDMTDRYPSAPSLILSDIERATVKRELYECALDIRAAIESGRFYRTGLRSHDPSVGCKGCFHRDLCLTERQHGRLDPQDIALLTMPYDPAERVEPATMLDDPRVQWYTARGMDLPKAVATTYGPNGVAAVQRYMNQGAA